MPPGRDARATRTAPGRRSSAPRCASTTRAASACAARPSLPGVAGEDGWLVTGDLGRIDDDGYLYVLGRADDVIVTGGENVSPGEVEEVLLEHPAVADAGVHGREDPEWQHAVVAHVVLAGDGGASEDDLRAFCRERLAALQGAEGVRVRGRAAAQRAGQAGAPSRLD